MKTLHLYIFTIISFALSLNVSAQSTTISGFIKDEVSKEPIVGATIFDPSSSKGCATNSEGYFSMFLPANKITLVIRSIGYSTKEITVSYTDNNPINILITPKTITTKEVKIEGEHKITSIRSIQTSAHSISPIELQSLPSLGGEKDIVKALQMLPGVTSGSEGSSSLVVRGGSPDQNLFLIDGVPIYNASHILGLFSVFTPEAISNVDFYKGGFPAQYGGRLSSVVDVSMKEGNRNHFTGDISIGTISSKALIEGPINKGKGAFIITGRRTYFDILAGPFIKNQNNFSSGEWEDKMTKLKLFFYDVTGKLTYQLSPKSKLFASFYKGKDRSGSEFEEKKNDNSQFFNYGQDIQWGNTSASLRWNHIHSSNYYSNFRVYMAQYKYMTTNESEQASQYNNTSSYKTEYSSIVTDWGLKYDGHWLASEKSKINWELTGIYHQFTPGKREQNSSNNGTSQTIEQGSDDLSTKELGSSIEWEVDPVKNIKARVGLRYSLYHTQNTTFHSYQPRISLRFMPTHFLSLKASYDYMQQPIHLLAQNSLDLGASIWVPATDKVSPGKSQQLTVGLSIQLSPQWLFSAEGWTKKLENQIEYRYGYYDSSSHWEDEITTGQGRASGIDFLIRKREGKTRGWISYTYSRNERQFDQLNNGQWYSYRYDRTHDFKVVAQHNFSKKVNIGLNYIHSTGYPFTVPESYFSSKIVKDFWDSSRKGYVVSSINNQRMNSYHRLDLSISFNKERRKGTRTWTFGVYNVYNRKNPYNYLIDYPDAERIRIREYSIFSIIPSITYRFNFK
ncbi:TonB-dependent receptor [Halosquirtibacter xylanolyticus]|uniref:TonB-dependent receptor n=1 Tax=Halosquirtibacter xylanolyticus TaxID=3374599 RepID=UPI003749BCCF|nr:TonB-dependent receptor [Prolixibacteraceae bacterium]